MKVGTSLSLCIQSILNGEVAESDVLCIRCNTKIENMDAWKRVMRSYSEGYWYENPQRGVEIAERLLFQNKLSQPRVLLGDFAYLETFEYSPSLWLDVTEPE